MIQDDFLELPILLAPDNFTPLKRTPWAGNLIARSIKANQANGTELKIGESWEFSCDRQFLSIYAKEKQLSIFDILKMYSDRGLDIHPEILVKLINAESPLSVQIHPDDHHPQLKANECGKPESWLILDAKPGAGIYLGLAKKISKSALRDALTNNSFQPSWLNFVPVKSGDYFEIGPGVPHAIGPGSVIYEPQKVLPNKNGVTWRMWDWNRKYNADGVEDQVNGKPRELHIEQALSVLSESDLVGAEYVDALRRVPVVSRVDGVEKLVYPKNNNYQISVLNLKAGQKASIRENEFLYGVFSVVEGEAIFQRQSKSLNQKCGYTSFVANMILPLDIVCHSQAAKVIVASSV